MSGAQLPDAVAQRAARHRAVLLANHGPGVAGHSLADAIDCAEDLKQTARRFPLARHRGASPLSAAQVAALPARFPN